MRPQMPPHRNTVRAKKIRAELVEKMGGVCVKCGAVDNLQFDHIDGARWRHNELSYLARMNRYKREHELGLLRLLCGDCNRAERKQDDRGRFIPTAHASLVPLTADLPY